MSAIIIQKGDLAASSFSNDNSNASGGIKVRVDAGSDVAVAIAAAATPDATDTVKGKVSLAVAANHPSTSNVEAATPAYVAAAIAAGGSVPDASATQAGIVNLTDGQVLGAGAKVIDGVSVSGQPNTSIINSNTLGEYANLLIGDGDTNATYDSTVIGHGAGAGDIFYYGTGPGTAVGKGATFGNVSAAVGNNAKAGFSSAAFGYGATAVSTTLPANDAKDALAVGNFTQATNEQASAVGTSANASHINSTALGFEAETTKDNQVVLGNGSVTEVYTEGNYVGDNFIGRWAANDLLSSALTVEVDKVELYNAALGGSSSNPTFTFTGATTGLVYSVVVRLMNAAGGAQTVTWPTGTIWDNGTPPTISTGLNAIDMFGFMTFDAGTTWHGVILAQNMS